MTCDEALDGMLDAAPTELRGQSDTALARHVAECDRCGSVATTLLEELDAVDRALDELAPADADAAADAALAAVRQQAPSSGPPTQSPTGPRTPPRERPRTRSRPRPRQWSRAWIPLAAAAALAAVLVLTSDRRPVPQTSPRPPQVEPRVSVTPPSDRGAAIMETENPNITIVWLYEREES